MKQIDPPAPCGDAVVIEARRVMRADPVPGETTQANVDRLRRTIAELLRTGLTDTVPLWHTDLTPASPGGSPAGSPTADAWGRCTGIYARSTMIGW